MSSNPSPDSLHGSPSDEPIGDPTYEPPSEGIPELTPESGRESEQGDSLSGPEPIFALVDVNNFYVSCERAFDPQLHGRPVVVMSNNDGCAIARSPEAKAMGIKMGTPVFKIREELLRQGGRLCSSNYVLYGDMSQRFGAVLELFSPRVEVYSIDEAFIDLSALPESAFEQATALRRTVGQWLKLPVSVGVAPTKTLAKLANKLAKKSEAGVYELLTESQQQKALADFPVEDLWGIGPALSRRLKNNNIHTALALRDTNLGWVRRQLTVTGARVVMELRGVSCLELETVLPPRRDIIASRSFGERVENHTEMREAVAYFVELAVGKLWRQQQKVRRLTIFLRTDPFRSSESNYFNHASVRLPVATQDTALLLNYALTLLESIYKSGFRYKKAGVMLSELTPAEESQGDLFFKHEEERAVRLRSCLNEINFRFGRRSLHYAAAGMGGERWRVRAEHHSPRYTTRWDELMRAY